MPCQQVLDLCSISPSYDFFNSDADIFADVELSDQSLEVSSNGHAAAEQPEPVLQAAEVLGFPIALPLFPSDNFTGIDTKRYALGQFPIGDGLLVWSKTAYPWVAEPITALAPPVSPITWREQWRREWYSNSVLSLPSAGRQRTVWGLAGDCPHLKNTSRFAVFPTAPV